jgi:hypothetical protein
MHKHRPAYCEIPGVNRELIPTLKIVLVRGNPANRSLESLTILRRSRSEMDPYVRSSTELPSRCRYPRAINDILLLNFKVSFA